jgi:hypothetical protein
LLRRAASLSQLLHSLESGQQQLRRVVMRQKKVAKAKIARASMFARKLMCCDVPEKEL